MNLQFNVTVTKNSTEISLKKKQKKTHMIEINKEIFFADNGIYAKDLISGFIDVEKYQGNDSHRWDLITQYIGGSIWNLAIDCLDEDTEKDSELIGFRMDVQLTPITQKK